MQEIKSRIDGTTLARRIAEDEWGDGLSFYSDDSEFIQVGTWAYPAGKELLAHRHNKVIREVVRTQEVIYVRQGAVRAEIFDLDDTLLETLEARAGDCLVLLAGGHGYEILEDGTQVLEVKNGPYPGPDADRTRLKKDKA
jgi:hypothetical protein